MGYTHSYGWEEKLPHAEQFVFWSADVAQLLACYNENPPPNPFEGEWWFERYPTLFGQWDTTICGPHGFDQPLLRPDFVAFNGSRASENHCERFLIDVRHLARRHFYECKTWGNPYDLLITAALIRFYHYFPQIAIYCGGGVEGLDAGTALCEKAFGCGSNPLRSPSYCRFVDSVFRVRSA